MTNLIKDPTFSKGFSILRRSLLEDNHTGLMSLPFSNLEAPTYRLAEYFTKVDLYHERDVRVFEGGYSIRNRCKEVIRDPQGRLTLGVDCHDEYDHPRQPNEPWPHLLVEQEFGYRPLSGMKSLIVELDVEILALESLMGEDRNDLHTLQASLYLAVGDRNPNSKSYRDFYWFGLPFMDAPRLDYPKPYCSKDVGKEDATGKLIYCIDPHIYLPTRFGVGDKARIKLDVLKCIYDGFAKAQELGYMPFTSKRDLGLMSLNIGFEATGAISGKIRIDKLNLMEEGENE